VRLTLIGAALGLAFTCAFAAFMEYRDTSLRSEDEILRALFCRCSRRFNRDRQRRTSRRRRIRIASLPPRFS